MPQEEIAQREADYVARRSREIAENKQREELLKTGAFDQEYEFWTKIISDEVARSRFNEGFEPIDCDLRPVKDPRGQVRHIGKMRICGRDFQCEVLEGKDAEDNKILKLSIRVQSRQSSLRHG